MTIASADLHKAVAALWSSSNLGDSFTIYWSAGASDQYPSLNDQEATPGQPWPYCVFEISEGSVTTRMTTDVAIGQRAIRDVPIGFRIHAKETDGDARSAKQIASDLAALIMAQYGGHPITVPQVLTLDNGNCLAMRYLGDYGIRTGDSEYEWFINYEARLDVPIAV